ncbi:hypothetical protein FRC02_010699 [Tulasnella sp. 418]|nr:hypothetical protein FRC02_010699 [Tulasnella sp. 418]
MPLSPSNAFPAALLDVIAAYRYLVLECHCPPERILLSGDSTGGALAIGLVRHLGTLADPDLRRPFALFLSSPWVDLSDSHLTNNPSCSIISNANCDIWSDYIVEDGMLFRSPMAGLINYARRSYIGFMEPEVMQHNPFISPASLYLTTPDGLFTGFPRTYIVSAGAEACRDSIRTLRDRLRSDVCKEQDDPNWVVYDEYEDAIHDFLAFEFHTPERKEAFQRFARWLDNVVDSSIL